MKTPSWHEAVAEESPCAVASSQRPKIMCIDDDPDITHSIRIILSNYDVDVNCEFCGRLGFYDILENRPDLIITDLRMAHGDGQQLLQQLRTNETTASTPVIVLSGQRDPQLSTRLKNMGASSFVQKPIPHSTLVEEIGKYIVLRELNWKSKKTS